MLSPASGVAPSLRIKNQNLARQKAVFRELSETQAFVQIDDSSFAEGPERGFLASAIYRNGAWWVEFVNLLSPKARRSAVRLSSSAKIRVLATPDRLPKDGVAILETDSERDLRETGLSVDDRDLLRAQAHALLTFSEFLLDPRFRRSSSPRRTTLLLGNDDSVYRLIATARNFEVFETLYDRYYSRGILDDSPFTLDEGPKSEVTEDFMLNAVDRYRLVFLLPKDFSKQSKIYGKQVGGYTYEEWKWLKSNPEYLKHVTFVVGVDAALVPSRAELFRSHEEHSSYNRREKRLREIFAGRIKGLLKP